MMTLRAGWIAAALVSACLCTAASAFDDPFSREVEAAVENGPLKGTLLLSRNVARSPVAIIIPGSGPTDRDGNNPLGIRAAPYRMLAEALSQKSAITIRIDKRGMFGSEGSFPDSNAVTIADYAGDVRAWIEVARREVGAPCSWLIGHSEGGLVALVAAQDPTDVCGLVLLAAPGRKMADVLRDQLWSNPANWPLLPDALAAISALERGEKVDISDFHPGLQNLFAPSVQGFLIDEFSYDPQALIAALDLPVLIVQGGNDIQIKKPDADRLSLGQPAAELVVLPDMNHVLKAVPPNDPAANFAAYADPDLPLAPGLANAVAGLMGKHNR